ncbi:hypothetical protein C0J52_22237, partial [Blattella germanica]
RTNNQDEAKLHSHFYSHKVCVVRDVEVPVCYITLHIITGRHIKTIQTKLAGTGSISYRESKGLLDTGACWTLCNLMRHIVACGYHIPLEEARESSYECKVRREYKIYKETLKYIEETSENIICMF